MKAKIYATKTCKYCLQVERYLTMKKVPYIKIMLEDEPEKWQKAIDATGVMTAPITEYNGKFVVGYDIGKLKELINGYNT